MLGLFKVIYGLKYLIPILISLYILDVRFGTLNTTYITRYCATQLEDNVNSLRDKVLDDVDDCSISPPIGSTMIWGKDNEVLLYYWNGTNDQNVFVLRLWYPNCHT